METLTQATTQVQDESTPRSKSACRTPTREVTELREHLEQVRRDASTDALTNLANRKAFDEQSHRACADADESGAAMTLAVIDIDHFKTLQRHLGPSDRRPGAALCRQRHRPRGGIAAARRPLRRRRVRHDLCPGESAALVEAALNGIREEIASRHLKRRSTNEDLGAVTISVGIAQRHGDESVTALMERADEALYASKRTGRNRVTNAERLDKAA